MIVFELKKRIDDEFVTIEISKSFKKELKEKMTKLLKPLIENYIDIRKMMITIEDFPQGIHDTNIMYCKDFCITNPYVYTVRGTLYWKSKTLNQPINLTDEVEKGSLEFWIENREYDFLDYLVKNLIENAHLRQKFYLEGYRFAVEVQMMDINSTMKVYFNEPLTEELKAKVENLLNHEVETFNGEGNGIIHSLGLTEFKKNKYLKFQIDYGSSGEEGINLLFDTLNKSEFDIRKIEVKGA